MAFRNSEIVFSIAKIKISRLLGKSIFINTCDVVSVTIKQQAGAEYAIITYKHNDKICKAYTYQHPFDHSTNALFGRQGLLESGSDWNNIYFLKMIVERMNESTLHPI